MGDRLFVTSRDNQLHALEISDADADWRWRTGADLLGAPVLDERRVYFLGLDNVLRGHNRNNGTMQWRRTLPMRPFAGPILSGQMIIVAGVASELRAYSSADGSPIGEMIVKGSENEEILLAAPPHLTAQGLVILVNKVVQVARVGSGRPHAQPPPPRTRPLRQRHEHAYRPPPAPHRTISQADGRADARPSSASRSNARVLNPTTPKRQHVFGDRSDEISAARVNGRRLPMRSRESPAVR